MRAWTTQQQVGKELTRIERSTFWRQQFATILLCRSHTPIWDCQHELANICLWCEGRLIQLGIFTRQFLIAYARVSQTEHKHQGSSALNVTLHDWLLAENNVIEKTNFLTFNLFSLSSTGWWPSNSAGRVDVYGSDRMWGTICGLHDWDLRDATVICRQLGLSLAARALANATFGKGTYGPYSNITGCIGSEARLFDCSVPRGPSGCSHSFDASATCSPGNIRVTLE